MINSHAGEIQNEMSQFPYEKASLILAEAELFGDKQVATRWDVSDRTIRRYRVKAATDSQLSSLVQLKKQLLGQNWRDDATKTLKVALNKLNELIEKDGDTNRIFAVSGAIKIVGELKISIDALSDPVHD